MDYIKKIVGERTSLDGTVLIGIGVVCLLFSPLVKWAAWGAIAYGAWTLLTKERIRNEKIDYIIACNGVVFSWLCW